jgi:lipoate-protein ligase A
MPAVDPTRADWLLLRDSPAGSAWNMAVDETLLLAAESIGLPVVRLYAWTEPAGTFGYSQSYAEVARATGLRPLVRRPTGGGLVPHNADWTYSLVFPPHHAWYRLRAEESYRQAHLWIAGSFARLGITTELAPCCRKEIPGQCFVGAEKYDVLWLGRKIAGAAQRRPKNGLLIQGSVQPPPIKLNRADWEQAFIATGSDRLGRMTEWRLDANLSRQAGNLATSKYATAAYNEKR